MVFIACISPTDKEHIDEYYKSAFQEKNRVKNRKKKSQLKRGFIEIKSMIRLCDNGRLHIFRMFQSDLHTQYTVRREKWP